MEFKTYREAKKYAKENGLNSVWDTKTSPFRYYVGQITLEMEDELGEDCEWEELFV